MLNLSSTRVTLRTKTTNGHSASSVNGNSSNGISERSSSGKGQGPRFRAPPPRLPKLVNFSEDEEASQEDEEDGEEEDDLEDDDEEEEEDDEEDLEQVWRLMQFYSDIFCNKIINDVLPSVVRGMNTLFSFVSCSNLIRFLHLS